MKVGRPKPLSKHKSLERMWVRRLSCQADWPVSLADVRHWLLLIHSANRSLCKHSIPFFLSSVVSLSINSESGEKLYGAEKRGKVVVAERCITRNEERCLG